MHFSSSKSTKTRLRPVLRPDLAGVPLPNAPPNPTVVWEDAFFFEAFVLVGVGASIILSASIASIPSLLCLQVTAGLIAYSHSGFHHFSLLAIFVFVDVNENDTTVSSYHCCCCCWRWWSWIVIDSRSYSQGGVRRVSYFPIACVPPVRTWRSLKAFGHVVQTTSGRARRTPLATMPAVAGPADHPQCCPSRAVRPARY